MVSADGDQVAIAAIDDDLEIGIAQLDPGGKRDWPPVGRVELVEAQIARHPPRATDARNDRDLVEIEFALDQRARETIDAGPDAASRTPDVRHSVHSEKRFSRMFHHFDCHCKTSSGGSWTGMHGMDEMDGRALVDGAARCCAASRVIGQPPE
jgi:hypothetical protein